MGRVQLIVARERVTSIWFEGRPRIGDAVWVSETAARQLLESGICRWPELKPAETPEAGPSEKPEAGPSSVPEVAPSAGKLLERKPGWPLDRFSRILRAWIGESVLLIAGGPSLDPAAVAKARGKVRAIAINNSYIIAPWADALYFADLQWWKWHNDRPEYRAFRGERITIENTGGLVSEAEVHMLHNVGQGGLSEQSDGLCTGSNGGYQALNIAFLAGASRIILTGYDMRYRAGKSHWHGGHPNKVGEEVYTRYARHFRSTLPQLQKAGVEVINCSPGSAIDCFPIRALDEVIG